MRSFLLLLYSKTKNHFSIRLKKWILHKNQRWPPQWLDWEAAPKHFPKPNLHPPKKSWSLFHDLLLIESTTAFWNHYIWEVCSSNQWDAPKTAMPAASIVNRKGTILFHDNARLYLTQPMLQKVNELGYKVLPHPPYSADLSPTDYTSSSISTTFCRENTSTISRRQKMLSKSSSIP